MKPAFSLLLLLCALAAFGGSRGIARGTEAPASAFDPFAADNLVAWCVVPFDAKKRGPEERAEMLAGLGFRKLAYDWREEHVPTFDAEVEAMKRRGIEITAWWFPGSLDATAREILAVIRRHGITPQLWITGGGGPVSGPEEQAARVAQEAARLKPVALAAAEVNCQVALYNHGGWFGEPENQIQIIEALKREGVTNAGIVYNFHHGHDHIDRFPEMLEKMKPYLLAVNLNGMDRGGDKVGRKILHLGEGAEEVDMMRALRESGWRGPVGIIDHRPETDTEETLRHNLRGLEWLKKELSEPGSGGPPPFTERERGALGEGKFGRALDARAGGVVKPEHPSWRGLPLTAECWVKLAGAASYNILLASEPKASATHWEVYTHPGGEVSVYLPGRGGDFRSNANLNDGEWHHVAAVLEEERVRLYVDGKPVKESGLKPVSGAPRPGGLGIGTLVEGGFGCDGWIDEVRLSRGARPPAGKPDAAPEKDGETVGLWRFDEPADLGAAMIQPRRRAPLNPAARPLYRHPVNRDRIYDFYAKQALHAMTLDPASERLAAFPGLDGGTDGHWGNQNEETWKGSGWSRMDLGSLQAGVFRGWGLTISRAVCVRLGERGEMAACFDPDTLSWRAAWTGGFVKIGSIRHGFMEGLQPAGERVALELADNEPAERGSFRYLGFYRQGARVFFHYVKDGAEWLDGAWCEDGKFVRTKTRVDAPEAAALTAPGAAQWPEVLETRGERGADVAGLPYVVDTVKLPEATPWRSVFHFGDHDFFDNGDAAVCTIEGEVWLVSGLDDSLERVRWKRFAVGLHQPLGLKIADGVVHVLGRDQITRLLDLNGDGEADRYECFSNVYETSPAGHDFITGLQRDREGRFYFASANQGVCRVSADGRELEVLATGFRNPDGLGLGPAGEILVAAQEGEWTPASMVAEVKPGGFYGYGGPKPGLPERTPPVVWLPRALDNSCGGQVFVEGEKWGLPPGTPVHLSFGTGAAFAMIRDTARPGQAGVVPLPGDFASGAHRGRFHPADGQLWVTGTAGWGTYTPEPGCLQRLRHTGRKFLAPVGFEARENGVLLTFNAPLSEEEERAAVKVKNWFAQAWSYRYGPAYGSDEYSARQPGEAGHDALEITSAHLVRERRAVFLEIPQLLPADTIHLFSRGLKMLSQDVFLTAHELAPPFTEFPGYRVIAKTGPAGDAASVLGERPLPVPWEEGAPGRAVLVRATTGLQFEQKELRVRAGERISLSFENPDVVPHNWVLAAEGSVERVVDLANRMIVEPGALARHYVPDSRDVLVHTRLVEPAASTVIHFNAPDKPGSYPYLCTFPGHGMVMRGVLVVE